MYRSCVITFIAASVLASAGCHRGAPAPGGASGSKPEAARKQAESLALNAITSAGNAQARARPELAVRRSNGILERIGVISPVSVPPNPPAVPALPASDGSATAMLAREAPQPKAAPRPGPSPVVRERIVSSLPYLSSADAEADAIKIACDVIEKQLAELDPPVRFRPTMNEVKNEFLRGDSRATRPLSAAERELFAKHDIKGNLVYVEFDVEVSPDQVRQLRTRDRVWDAARVVGTLTAIALAGFLFLRLDEYTKGYMTQWLAIAAVVLAGGAAAVLYWV